MSDNKVTLDQLDNSAVEAMSSSVGDVSMLNTENKTIVGALAEIVGKKEIANAIGEPLAETDKFTEMSSEINGLLSTFKTNMMNAGVVVESGDQFKALIDKIKGLTEGEGNKGIKYANGTLNDVQFSIKHKGTANSAVIEYNLDFTPSIIFIICSGTVMKNSPSYATLDNIVLSNMYTAGLSSTYSAGHADYTVDIIDITQTQCTIMPAIVHTNDTDAKLNLTISEWYAIGVGEEDTTLRDSLADILQEEGVSVTEEDDMASLISKVDEEFDRQVVPAGNAVASDVISGKTFINSTGKTVTGTATISSLGGMQFASGNVDLSWDSENGSQTYTISGLTFTPKHFIICFSDLFLYERNGVNATFKNVHLFDNTKVSDSSGETYVYISKFSKTSFTIYGYHNDPSYGIENQSYGTIVAWYAFG